MSEIKHLTLEEVNIMYEEIKKLRAALATARKEVEELKGQLKALNALDPDGDWPSYGSLALMFSELKAERDEAVKALKSHQETESETLSRLDDKELAKEVANQHWGDAEAIIEAYRKRVKEG
jgi:chromosome segregation ATPase